MSDEGSRHTEDNGEKQGIGFEKRSPRERALEFRSHENSFVKSWIYWEESAGKGRANKNFLQDPAE